MLPQTSYLTKLVHMVNINVEPFEIDINDRVYSMTNHVAALLSSKVFNALQKNPKIQKMPFKCDIKLNVTYSIFEQLTKGIIPNRELSKEESKDLFKLGVAIDNQDLIQPYAEMFKNQDITLENLDDIKTIYISLSNISPLINFLSNNLVQVKMEKLVQICLELGFNAVETILSSTNCRNGAFINSLILNLIDVSRDFLILTRFLDESSITADSFEHIINIIQKEDDYTDYINLISFFKDRLCKSLIYKRETYKKEIGMLNTQLEIVTKEKNLLIEETEDLEQTITDLIYEQKRMVPIDELKVIKGKFDNLVKEYNNLLPMVSNLKELSTSSIEKTKNLLEDQFKREKDLINNIKSLDLAHIYSLLTILMDSHSHLYLKFLIDNGICEILSPTGDNVVFYAVQMKNMGLIEEFRKLNVRLQIKNGNGENLLHYAVKSADLNMLVYLMDILDINKGDNQGMTPLHIAVINDNPELVKVICTYEKCQINVWNANGDTPLDVAKTIDMKNLLAGYGAISGAFANHPDLY